MYLISLIHRCIFYTRSADYSVAYFGTAYARVNKLNHDLCVLLRHISTLLFTIIKYWFKYGNDCTLLFTE